MFVTACGISRDHHCIESLSICNWQTQLPSEHKATGHRITFCKAPQRDHMTLQDAVLLQMKSNNAYNRVQRGCAVLLRAHT